MAIGDQEILGKAKTVVTNRLPSLQTKEAVGDHERLSNDGGLLSANT